MRFDDLSAARVPSDPRVHGDRIAFVVTRIDLDEDRYERSIWLADSSGVHAFTSGPDDTNPRWSPDGSHLAFLRKTDGFTQVAVISTTGGEARIVSDFSLGAEAVEWSPDGTRLVAVGIGWAEEWDGLDETERTRRPRRIRTFPYRFDNKGRLDDRRRHLWLLDPEADVEPRCLTDGPFDEQRPAWSPDGTTIAFLTDRSERRGLDLGTDVFAVDVDSGDERRLAGRGMWVDVSYRPDGVLHLVGDPEISWPGIASLWRANEDGTLTALTVHLDRSHVSLSAGQHSVHWDGQAALVGFEDAGAFGVVRVHPDGTVDHLVDGRRMVSGFSIHDAGLVFTASSPVSPGELWRVARRDGGDEQSVYAAGDLETVEGEHFRVASEGVEIDAWAYLPPGEDRVPLLLNIHGGPASQYGYGFFDEFQVYAGAGFGVVACNPRGSAGRGIDFLQAVVGEGWGVVDSTDIAAVVDTALQRFPRLDADRMGIMGGSYGGFLTAWIIGHEERWSSAVVERALLSFPSFAGTSDIGATFPALYTGADYPDGWVTWWEKSPLAFAHQVTTPTLVLHSEDDFRCPIEQAEQYFLALLRNDTPTELLRFPGEGHEMSRSGRPRHRQERFEAIIDWHRRHLLD